MELSIQTGNIDLDFGVEALCQMVTKAGFTAVDWNIDHAWKSSKIWKADFSDHCIFEDDLDTVLNYYQPEIELFSKYGLKITQAHAPFPSCVPDRPEVLPYAIKIYKRCIELCEAVGVKNLVIHGVSLYEWDKVSTYKDIENYNLELYGSLIPTLMGTSVTVCLENLPIWSTKNDTVLEGTCCDPYEAVELIDKLNALCGNEEHFGLCFDVGHAQISHVNIRQYINIVGKRIKCLHIHDNTGYKDEHRMPYAGTINWNYFLKGLMEIGYDGDLSFETFNQYKLGNLPKELVPYFVEAVGATGKYFKDVLTGVEKL